MENFFADKIKNIHFTRGQRKIAEYFLENQLMICQKSLLDISKDIGVSDVSVLRFVRAIGYEGFTDLKNDLYSKLSEKIDEEYTDLSLSSRMDINVERHKDKNFIEAYLEIMHVNIQKSILQNSEEKYETVVQNILDANNKFIVGFRGCKGTAAHFARTLRYLLDDVIEITSGSVDIFGVIQGMKKGDVLLMFCFARYYTIDVKVVEFAKMRGVRICLITDNLISPVSYHADTILHVENKGLSFFNSAAGANCIGEYLNTLISQRMSYTERLDKIDEYTEVFRC